MSAGYPLQVRLQREELSAVDEYRRSYTNPPSRGEAVRRLTRAGLKRADNIGKKREIITPADRFPLAQPA
jgi:hypothetical protein